MESWGAYAPKKTPSIKLARSPTIYSFLYVWICQSVSQFAHAFLYLQTFIKIPDHVGRRNFPWKLILGQQRKVIRGHADNRKNEDHLKHEDALKNPDKLNNEDSLRNEDSLKNEEDLKIDDYLKIKGTFKKEDVLKNE